MKYKNDVLSESNKIESLPADVEINEDVYEIKEDGSIISVVNTIKPGKTITSEQGNTAYTKNGTAIIPVGFSIVPGLDDVSQGLVISDVENDTGDTGNQFVWIPVTDSESYKTNTTYTNTSVSENTENDTGYLPDEIDVGNPTEEKTIETLTFEKEKELVISKGGFYISRYEAGDSSVEANRTSATDGTLVSKKDAYVYNYISQTDAKAKAKTFINNKDVKSALASGVQWDMVMAFISKETRKDGNGVDDYIVITNNPARHTGDLQQSGQNEADRVCNIYDLEGNYYEYVAEKNTYHNINHYVDRGGAYNNGRSASYRNDYFGDARSIISFRFILYVM